MAQIIVALCVSVLVSILLTPVLIKKFRQRDIRQEIREDGPQTHLVKTGTPTMGGLAILAGIWAGYFSGVLVGALTDGGGPAASGLLVLMLTTCLGLVGFADDAIKVFKKRNLGLTPKAKFLGQFVAAILFAVLAIFFPNEHGLTPASKFFSITRDIPVMSMAAGGGIVFIIFAYFVITAWSNAVNITDGLDGLAAGSMALVMGAYTIITFWQFRNACSTTGNAVGCYQVRDPLDISILCAAALGACIGFLWWNCNPAKIFMGDTGSLALGGLVAGISIVSRTELLMVVIGALFVIEIFSVVLQVGFFKATGRRILRMAPFHHHFELGGWKETTVIVRFWLIAGLSAGLGMAVFYADWLSKVAV